MPHGCRWHSIGSFFLDGVLGASAHVDLSVAIDAAGLYWVRARGDETQVESFASAADVVDLFEGYPAGLESLVDHMAGMARFQSVYLMAQERLRS